VLTQDERDRLGGALRQSRLPLHVCRFADGSVLRATDPEEVTAQVGEWLRAKDPDLVLEGLSNVLYWRFQLEGQGQEDVYDFRAAVRRWSLVETLRLVDGLQGPGLVSLANLGLPVFRDLFRLSALRMLLEPGGYTCLRPRHLALRSLPGRTVLHDIRPDGPHWPPSLLNEACYERWNRICRRLAAQFEPAWRASDVERALSKMIEDGEDVQVLRLVQTAECLPSP